MPLTLRRLLAEVSDPSRAGQTITLRDQVTQTVISSVTLDGSGLGVLPLSWEQLLRGVAAGDAEAQATTQTAGAAGGGAPGQGGGAGTLSQNRGLAGAAGAHAGAAAGVTEAAPGTAGGQGGGSGTLGVVQPGSAAGAAGGDAEASGTLSQNVDLGGAAGGKAGAGPSTQAQQIPIAGAAAGHGAASGTVTQGKVLSGAADGHALSVASATVTVGSATGQYAQADANISTELRLRGAPANTGYIAVVVDITGEGGAGVNVYKWNGSIFSIISGDIDWMGYGAFRVEHTAAGALRLLSAASVAGPWTVRWSATDTAYMTGDASLGLGATNGSTGTL